VFQQCSGTSRCSKSVLVLPCVPRVFWHFPVFQECCHFTVSLTREGEETFFVNTGNIFVLFPAFMQSITAYEDGSKFADCLTVRGTYVAQLVSSADNLITTIHFVEAYTVNRKKTQKAGRGRNKCAVQTSRSCHVRSRVHDTVTCYMTVCCLSHTQKNWTRNKNKRLLGTKLLLTIRNTKFV
jgi:hypothetical protein